MPKLYDIGDRVVSKEDGAHGVIEEVIDERIGVYAIKDDDGTEWVGFDGDFYAEIKPLEDGSE